MSTFPLTAFGGFFVLRVPGRAMRDLPRLRPGVCEGGGGAYGLHPPLRGARFMVGIVAAVLFFIAFLINAAEISTNDVFSSTNVMLLGLMCLALHMAGVGAGWSRRR